VRRASQRTKHRPVGAGSRRRSLLILAAAIVGVVLAAWLLFVIPAKEARNITDPAAHLLAVNDGRRTWAQIIGAIGLAGGLWFSWRNSATTREVWITDRLGRAVQQLTSKKLAVRLGGIYALGRIAADSRRDHPSIVEILSSYIHERTRWNRPEGHQSRFDVVNRRESWVDPEATERQFKWAKPDIQAALVMLAQRRVAFDVERIRLGGCNLAGAGVPSGDLSRASLDGSNFEHSGLARVRLVGVSAYDTVFDDAALSEADFQDATLVKARFRGADLRRANLRGANLTAADFIDANLSEAVLDGADVDSAIFSGAQLKGTSMKGTRAAKAHGLSSGKMRQVIIDANTTLPEGVETGDDAKVTSEAPK